VINLKENASVVTLNSGKQFKDLSKTPKRVRGIKNRQTN
jgi:hypothetical protein